MTTMNRRGRRTQLAETGLIRIGLFRKLQCEIRDVSPGGARIVIPEGAELPEEFRMRLPHFKTPRHCIRRWQCGSETGVEFKQD
ncbi:PilZ domain-containing protein [Hyphomonas johnsonii]|jgi:hypothetical protein|uniref:PilZ domain-containing protein n=1 Tax=Hyphomonas johnsonii MHS-2 TaxID=1280950 RepID=A0A059FFZ8_9PROT|nr:PilZ domain-containing protein [Hyphomonas johnsonii]KCZ89481.1 hypothetical protein HJO_14722 [Hyphomonas johnsonii MHS-2]